MNRSIEQRIGELLNQYSLTLSTAESCTGGLIAHNITNIPGSSNYFAGAAVVYSNEAKISLLDVQPTTLEKYGAVSKQTVLEMAIGVRIMYRTEAGLSVSGIAGPGGGSEGKPVGLVWFGVNVLGRENAWKFNFQGGRLQIKEKAAQTALELLEEHLNAIKIITEDTGDVHDQEKTNTRYDQVRVWGTFDREGNFTPDGFLLHGVEHPIEIISRHWQDGDAMHYLVMVPIDSIYELIFNYQAKRWYLKDLNQKPGGRV